MKAAKRGKAKVIKTTKLKRGWIKQIIEITDGRQHPKYINPEGGPAIMSLKKAEAIAKGKLE